MKTFKNMIAAAMMVAVLSVTTTFAGDGILVAGVTGEPTGEPCTAATKGDYNAGILVAGATGILVAGFTGILVAGFSDSSDNETCGILVAG